MELFYGIALPFNTPQQLKYNIVNFTIECDTSELCNLAFRINLINNLDI